MGRPLNKKYFGNRNVGVNSPTDDGIGGEGVASVTLGGTWAGFTGATTTVLFSAPELPGGTTATGTAVIDGSGNITSITITSRGSGYVAAPTVTITDSDVGSETTGTATAVLTTDSGNVGSATNMENAIVPYAQTTSGGSRSRADIIKQVSGCRYKVKTSDGTAICTLRTDGGSGNGTMDLTAFDSDGGEYWVAKLTGRKAVLVIKGTNGGSQFATGQSVPWTLSSAIASYNVKIENA